MGVFGGDGGKSAVPATAMAPVHQQHQSTGGRICASKGCIRALVHASKDPHSLCVHCRSKVCSVEDRCSECTNWDPDLVIPSSKYPHAASCSEDRMSDSHIPFSSDLPTPLVGSGPPANVSFRDLGEVNVPRRGAESVVPVDSAPSLDPNSAPSSAVISELKTLLGLDGKSLDDIIADKVSAHLSSIVSAQLGRNTSSITATPVSPVDGSCFTHDRRSEGPASGLHPVVPARALPTPPRGRVQKGHPSKIRRSRPRVGVMTPFHTAPAPW